MASRSGGRSRALCGQRRGNRAGTHGFAMLALLIVVALMGLALASTAAVWSTQSKREKEAELLRIGSEFRRAIESYAMSSQGEQQYPRTLEDLVKDPRFPNIRRHLRRIYADPFTGKPEWGLVKLGDAIVGVYSLAEGTPLKSANFDDDVTTTTESQKSYADWKFVYKAEGAGARVGSSTGGGDGIDPRPAVIPGGVPVAAPRPNDAQPPAPRGNYAACQAALGEQYKHCAEIADVDQRSACLQTAIAAHQQCLQAQ